MPFWWERLGLLFKGLRQMVGASCEAKEEKEKKKKTKKKENKLDSVMPRPDKKT